MRLSEWDWWWVRIYLFVCIMRNMYIIILHALYSDSASFSSCTEIRRRNVQYICSLWIWHYHSVLRTRYARIHFCSSETREVNDGLWGKPRKPTSSTRRIPWPLLTSQLRLWPSPSPSLLLLTHSPLSLSPSDLHVRQVPRLADLDPLHISPPATYHGRRSTESEETSPFQTGSGAVDRASVPQKGAQCGGISGGLVCLCHAVRGGMESVGLWG